MSCARACRSSVVVVPLMALRRFLSAFVARRTVALWCAQVLVGLEHTEGGARPRRGPAVVAVEVLQFTPLPHRRRPGAALEGDALAVFERHVGVEEGPPLGFPHGGVGEELELLSEVVPRLWTTARASRAAPIFAPEYRVCLTLSAGFVAQHGASRSYGTPKNHERREVALDDHVVSTLKGWRKRRLLERLARGQTSLDDEDLVFTGETVDRSSRTPSRTCFRALQPT